MRRRCVDGVGQQPGGRVGAVQRGRRQQPGQAVVEFVGLAHAACGEQARQQRVHAGLLQRKGGARRHVAGLQVHHRASSRASGSAPRQRAVRRCQAPGWPTRWVVACVRRTA